MPSLPYRQVHLDFHTSGEIPEVGAAFDPAEFRRGLENAAIDSITCFSVCHHGYSYHPTRVGVMHPGLKFDLLRAQMDAAHEAGAAVPVYLSAGGNDVAALAHPEWCEVNPPGVGGWGAPDERTPGFRKLCFNTPYLDYLCRLTDETLERFPDADGLFFDIILQCQCVCPKCVADMRAAGLDPESEADRLEFSQRVLINYYERIAETVRKHNPEMPVFHNSGHVDPARPELFRYFSHLELESLPTGGWGYDHFPQSAAFARRTGLEFSGMTGKFHGTWGEFGGFKHPNALRYECCVMLAAGARCSVGDQLHPTGKLDKTSCDLIGQAYREVREKEPFCRNAINLADVGVLSAAACGIRNGGDADTGAARILQEGHFLFDFLHPDMEFTGFKLLILPEEFDLQPALAEKLRRFAADGGKVLLIGRTAATSGLDFGAEFDGPGTFSPTYLLPAEAVRPDYLSTPFVVRAGNWKIRAAGGESLGDIYEPYFNREPGHFCSHQHTPNRPEPFGYSAGAVGGNAAVLAQSLFAVYACDGAVVLRLFLDKVLRRLLDKEITIESNLPSTARLTVTRDEINRRIVVHLLYADIVKRGRNVEVIEDLPPLYDTELRLRIPETVRSVTMEPQHDGLSFRQNGGRVETVVPLFRCHQMIVFSF